MVFNAKLISSKKSSKFSAIIKHHQDQKRNFGGGDQGAGGVSLKGSSEEQGEDEKPKAGRPEVAKDGVKEAEKKREESSESILWGTGTEFQKWK